MAVDLLWMSAFPGAGACGWSTRTGPGSLSANGLARPVGPTGKSFCAGGVLPNITGRGGSTARRPDCCIAELCKDEPCTGVIGRRPGVAGNRDEEDCAGVEGIREDDGPSNPAGCACSSPFALGTIK